MAKLTIMRGIPGSGKSTLAAQIAQDHTVIVSRDSLRFALFGRYTNVDEDAVTVVEHHAIRTALENGHDVISDNTNIHKRFVNKIARIGWEQGADVALLPVHVPLAVAIERNAQRERKVPEAVIERMFHQYKDFVLDPPKTFERYEPDRSLPRCILFDVDGTLAAMGDRGPFDWGRVGEDAVIPSVADMTLAFNYDVQVIVFSGRDGVSLDATVSWLMDNNVYFDKVIMRAEGDMRPDSIVKMEMFDEHIRNNFYCLGVFDDRPAVVRQWMKHNVPVFHVTPFNRDF